MAADGRFAIGWISKGQDHADGREGVYAQGYAADGSALGGEFRVNTTTLEVQAAPSPSACAATARSSRSGRATSRTARTTASSASASWRATRSPSWRQRHRRRGDHADRLGGRPQRRRWRPALHADRRLLGARHADGDAPTTSATVAAPAQRRSGAVALTVQKINEAPTQRAGRAGRPTKTCRSSSRRPTAMRSRSPTSTPTRTRCRSALSVPQGTLRLATHRRADLRQWCRRQRVDRRARAAGRPERRARRAALHRRGANYFGADTLTVTTNDLGTLGSAAPTRSPRRSASRSPRSTTRRSIVSRRRRARSRARCWCCRPPTATRCASSTSMPARHLEVTLTSVNGDAEARRARTTCRSPSARQGRRDAHDLPRHAGRHQRRAERPGVRADRRLRRAGLPRDAVNDLGNSGAGGALGDRDLLEIDVVAERHQRRAGDHACRQPDHDRRDAAACCRRPAATRSRWSTMPAACRSRSRSRVDSGTLTLGTSTGSEFQVNSTVAGDQQRRAVATAPDGGYVVVWQSTEAGRQRHRHLRAALQRRRHRARRRSPASTPPPPATRREPAVAMAADGSFVVVWTSNGQDGGGSAASTASATTPTAQRWAASSASTPRPPTTRRAPAVAIDAAGALRRRLAERGPGRRRRRHLRAALRRRRQRASAASSASTPTPPSDQQRAGGRDGRRRRLRRRLAERGTRTATAGASTRSATTRRARARRRVPRHDDQLQGPARAGDRERRRGQLRRRLAEQGRRLQRRQVRHLRPALRRQRQRAGPQFLVNTTTPERADGAGGRDGRQRRLRRRLAGPTRQDNPDGSEGIYAQRYDSGGAARRLGVPRQHARRVDEQTAPRSRCRTTASCVAVWTQRQPGRRGLGVFGQRYLDAAAADASAVGDGVDDAAMTFTGTLDADQRRARRPDLHAGDATSTARRR